MSKCTLDYDCMISTEHPNYPVGYAVTTVTSYGGEVETLRLFRGSQAERLSHAVGIDRARLHQAQVRSERGEIPLLEFEDMLARYEEMLAATVDAYMVMERDGGIES